MKAGTTTRRVGKVQKQHRPDTRAPHGEREFTERFGVLLRPAQKRFVMRKGGGGFVRQLIDAARKAGG